MGYILTMMVAVPGYQLKGVSVCDKPLHNQQNYMSWHTEISIDFASYLEKMKMNGVDDPPDQGQYPMKPGPARRALKNGTR